MTKTVLIADDEPNIVISLEYLLQREGYHVLVARDGQEALDAVDLMRPDLVLLDVMLPKVSGFEVCQKLRANPALNRMRILMLTAKGRDVEMSKGMALGADAYITKPFSTQDLLAQIRAQLGAE
jgi:DNA-binding response OmpR family regulator